MTKETIKLELIKIQLTSTNNPLLWTQDTWDSMLKGRVAVGYLLRSVNKKWWLSLYIIPKVKLDPTDKILNLQDILNNFLQWLESLGEDSNSYIFRNPPLRVWLDTKENWAKKLASNLANSFNLPFDECLSTVYCAIVNCYKKSHVYIGNLGYIETTARNDLKMDIRFLRNRLTGDSWNACSLDASVTDSDGEGMAMTYHDIIGVEDPHITLLEFECTKAEILKDMSKVFSKRELDQVLNQPGYLPMPLYRKLNRWRAIHKRGDYE